MQRVSREKVDNIRSRQIASIKQILNFNQPVLSSIANEPVWKILILDHFTQDVISPLIPVKTLRENGVTLHFLISTPRETLPDVPAVYLVSPTDDNIRIICEDVKKAMYDNFYINTVLPIARPQLELIASAAVHSGMINQIQKVADQFLAFISLEDDLFALRRYTSNSPFSFHAINDPSITPEQMDDLINGIANSLFSVCATLGVVPIIKCGKDNAAEQVAIKLDQKIRDNLRDARNNLFTQEHIRGGQFSMHRPVFVIADRNIDLATMLHHTWTYQALVHDVLGLDSNRVRMVDSNGKQREYDMDQADQLWMGHRGSPFPVVAEAIQTDLEKVKASEKSIKDLKSAMGYGEESDEAIIVWSDTTSKLSSAVGSLGDLLKQKAFVELHTNVATSLLSDIKQRHLDVLFENEEKLLNGQTDVGILGLLNKSTNHDDILRVMLIYFLCSPNITKSDKDELRSFLAEREIDDSALRYIERLRSFSTMAKLELHQGAGTKSESMFSNLLQSTSKIFMEGVKNLVPKQHNLPLTRFVDQMVDTRPSGVHPIASSGDVDDCRYYDPKFPHGTAKDQSRARGGSLAQDVLVFVIGGGNYVEYQNLVDYAKNKGIQRLTYGCTELVTPHQFMDQLRQLGQQLR